MVFIKIEAAIALRSFLLGVVMWGHRSRCRWEGSERRVLCFTSFSVFVSFGQMGWGNSDGVGTGAMV